MRLAAVLSVIGLWPTSVGAQCVTASFAFDQADPNVARIFVGTAKASKDVTFRNMVPNRTNPDFRGQAVTFEVDRVWKGPANRTVVVHNITEGSEPTARGQGMHTFEFSVGHRYFLRVYLMHPDTRIRLGLNPDGPEAFMAGCPLRESRDPLAEGLVDDDPGIAVVTP